jgi:hypothetical protein
VTIPAARLGPGRFSLRLDAMKVSDEGSRVRRELEFAIR